MEESGGGVCCFAARTVRDCLDSFCTNEDFHLHFPGVRLQRLHGSSVTAGSLTLVVGTQDLALRLQGGSSDKRSAAWAHWKMNGVEISLFAAVTSFLFPAL